jgi:NADPH-dependent ferric siderophore reductase
MNGPYRPWLTTLTGRTRLSPSFVRVTLSAPDGLRHCAPTLLDQRVKLLVGGRLPELVGGADWYADWLALPDHDRPTMRTYTLAAVRPEQDEVDIDVVVHHDPGPVAAWAEQAPLGTSCVLVATDVRSAGHEEAGVAWRPQTARDVLVVGDETALPAIANIVASLKADTTGRVVVEVPEEDDIRALELPAGVRVTWCVRANEESAVDAVAFPSVEVPDDPEDLLWDEAAGDDWYGWVAGEAGMVRQIRAAARAAGVNPRRMAFMGYWKRGAASI